MRTNRSLSMYPLKRWRAFPTTPIWSGHSGNQSTPLPISRNVQASWNRSEMSPWFLKTLTLGDIFYCVSTPPAPAFINRVRAGLRSVSLLTFIQHGQPSNQSFFLRSNWGRRRRLGGATRWGGNMHKEYTYTFEVRRAKSKGDTSRAMATVAWKTADYIGKHDSEILGTFWVSVA